MKTNEKVILLAEWYERFQKDNSTPSGKAVVQWYEENTPRHSQLALLTMLAYALDELDKVGGNTIVHN